MSLVNTLVSRLGLANHHGKDGILCPQCNLPIADAEPKTLARDIHEGFVWHENCYNEFLSPPLRLRAM